MSRQSLGKILNTRGKSLANLANHMGVSRSYIAELGEYAKSFKTQTWTTWAERFLGSLPYLGSTFPDVLLCKEFATCPPPILEYMLQRYIEHINVQTQSPFIESEKFPTRQTESELIALAQKKANEAKWFEAEELYAEAARFRNSYDNEWIQHRLSIAELKNNRGDATVALDLLQQAVFLHNFALERLGEQWHPYTLALARATRGWSFFLQGQWKLSLAGFERTVEIAQVPNDNALLNRGLHMGARAIVEPKIISFRFPDFAHLTTKVSSNQIERGLNDIDLALELDNEGSARQAFGFWYRGEILTLMNDPEAGSFLNKADSQLMETDENNFAALSHTKLTLIHYKLRDDPVVSTYKKCEHELLKLFHRLREEEFPYPVADALITIAYCRYSAKTLTRQLNETTDFLFLALTIHPYPEHDLWKIGRTLLWTVVLPAFGEHECQHYLYSLVDRAKNGEYPFDYVAKQRFDLQPLYDLEQNAKKDF